MKNQFIFILLLFSNLCSAENSFSATGDNQNFNQVFTGQLNHNVKVIFSIKNTNGKLTGFYYYDKIGIEIKLIGEITDGNAVIYELDHENKKLAKISGKLSESSFTGTWQSLTTKKSYPLQLKPTKYAIPALPKKLIGIYSSQDSACNVIISITKIKDDYFYHFTSKSRKLKGKITFIRSLAENLVYINFIGIEWAEDDGDVSKDFDKENATPNKALPTVVQGLLDDGEIVIQNYGNAMNHYLKFGECDVKYISLKKK